MTFTPNSKVRLCSVPFSDYTNVMSFGNDDESRANYFISKTVYNLTSADGYSYVKGSGAIRVNKNKESLYNVNYMMYRNDYFGSKWFYAFVDSIEYINANVTEIKFTTDVWQTWESALNFHDSFIVRQHIPKIEDTIGANLQPEGFTNLRYVEEKRKRKDLNTYSFDECIFMVLSTSWYDSSANSFKDDIVCADIDNTLSGLYVIPFFNENSVKEYISHYVNGSTANRADEIIAIYEIPKDFSYNRTLISGIPLGVGENNTSGLTTSNSWTSLTNEWRISKLNSIDIGVHGNTNIKTANNNKMYTFPFTKIVLTNNNGSSLTFRQEFFDGTKSSGDDIVFNVTYNAGLPVTGICYPDNYREGDETNALVINGFPLCSWSTDTYSKWLALNQNSIKYKQNEISYSGIFDVTNTLVDGLQGKTGFIDYLQQQIGNVASNAKKAFKFYNEKQDMMLQPNNSQGSYNSSNILGAIDKMNFTVCFYRLTYEQFKQIDNYFDKFGYAINDFKSINYNNRSNFDYIETSQVVVDGDVPEDDINVIKNIFNSGVRIWHDTSTFLNYSAYEYNTSDKK